MSSSSPTQQLYVLWTALQLLVICSLVGLTLTRGLDEDGSGIPEFDNSGQNISAENEDSNRIIYLLTLLPYPAGLSSSNDGGNSLQSGLVREMKSALLTAAELAVDHINKDPYTLPGHRVELIHGDSDCNMTTTALITFIKHVLHNEHKGRLIAGIIGPVCSESAIAISSILGRGGQLVLPNVHIALTAELEDRDKYPYSFGIVGSRFQIVDAIVSLICYNGWKEVAILYDKSRALAALNATHRLREKIRSDDSGNRGFSLLHLPINDKFLPLETLTESKVQIGIVMSTLALAQKLMCIAYHEGMIYPGYQWIVAEYRYCEFIENTNTTFYYEGRLYKCFWNTQEIALDHVVFVHFQLSAEDTSLRLMSGYTYADIAKQYEMKFVFHNKNDTLAVPKFVQAATTYDAVWALVLVMNMTVSEKSSNFKINALNKFPNVNFRGASGHIIFDRSTGFTQRVIEIDQIHDGIRIPAGSVFQGNISLFINPRIKYITTSQPQYYASVNPVLASFFVLAEVTLVLSTAVVHIVTLLNQKYPSIKASSPGLNQFVFLACYIWGVVAIIYTLVLKALGLPDFIFIGNACQALLVWLVPIALTLSFGTLIAKTWRMYRIFIHFRHPGPLLTNKALTMMVLIQLGIDIAIATAWTIASPMMLVAIEEESYMNENGDTIIPRMCVYTNMAIWLTMTIGYKFLQIIVLLILCIMTINITNKKFSTTLLKVASYLCLLVIAILGPLHGILWYTNAEIHADFVVFSMSFCAIGFTLLFLVLLPPALPLFIQYQHLCHRKKTTNNHSHP